MTEDKQAQLKELSSFMQDRGFVYGPAPEIYGGLAGFFDYGPLGKLVKNRVESAIRKSFSKNAFFEVECPTVMQEEVWIASGHAGGFSDPVIKDKAGNSFRVDNLIEEFFRNNNLDVENIKLDGASHEELLKIIKDNNIKSPVTNEEFIFEIKEHNLMMKTTIGLDKVAYNRPETATTTYLPFLRYVNFFRDKLPFSVFQIGKAYRNEISPRQFMLRMREFTQAEAQVFLFKDQKLNFEKFDDVKDIKLPLWSSKAQEISGGHKEHLEKFPQGITLKEAVEKNILKNQAYAWTLNVAYQTFLAMGIPASRIRLRQHNEDEMAFYAEDAWDLEVNLNTFGWTEMCGIHDRKDYDLGVHSKASGVELVAPKPEGGKEMPHILEIAFGVDRPTFALLDIFYNKKDKEEGKTTLEIPYHMSPIPITVMPLTNKLHDEAYALFRELQEDFIALYDKSGSVGKRYLRADSIGVPFCITYDFDTLEKDKSVTLRDRDSGEQKRIEISKLSIVLKKLIEGKKNFADI